MKALLFLIALSIPASAADYAIILNDTEKKALLELIDAAVKANGLGVAAPAAYLAQKINAAGVVTATSPQEEAPK